MKVVNRDNADIGLSFSPDYMEAPWMIKRGNKYVLFTGSPYKKEQEPANNNSGLTTGYWVGVSMADNIGGPYVKQPQIFLGGHIAVFTGLMEKNGSLTVANRVVNHRENYALILSLSGKMEASGHLLLLLKKSL